MTLTTPFLFITLHFLQMGLTDALTFIKFPRLTFWHRLGAAALYEFFPVCYPSPCKVVGGKLHRDLVAGQDSDVVLAHLPGDVGGHDVTVLQLYSKHRIRQGLGDRPLHLDNVVFRHGSCVLESSSGLVKG